MLFLGADENFNNAIVRGLLPVKPDLDIVRVQDVGLSAIDDRAILEWAANEDRVLLTHDVTTITKYAYERVDTGRYMPGVIEVSRKVALGAAIEEILYVAEVCDHGELDGQIIYLPLKQAGISWQRSSITLPDQDQFLGRDKEVGRTQGGPFM